MKVIYAYCGVSCAEGNLKKSIQTRSTNWAASVCNGKSKCSGKVSHSDSALADFYPQCNKDFIVVAECSNGKIIADQVKKRAIGKKFSLDCC